jgi:hypothetical protein
MRATPTATVTKAETDQQAMAIVLRGIAPIIEGQTSKRRHDDASPPAVVIHTLDSTPGSTAFAVDIFIRSGRDGKT